MKHYMEWMYIGLPASSNTDEKANVDKNINVAFYFTGVDLHVFRWFSGLLAK